MLKWQSSATSTSGSYSCPCAAVNLEDLFDVSLFSSIASSASPKMDKAFL